MPSHVSPQQLRLLTLAVLCALSTDAIAETAPSADDAATELDRITVTGTRYLPDYTVHTIRSATRTDTPLLDTPQAATVVTEELIRDQAMSSLSELLRYVPGVGVAQGEGNRDTPVMRGSSTTADFFVDGIRDDVQYIRDLYDIQRVEVLKGPNAMIFGRGGSGGIVNRVTKVADGREGGSVSLQVGNWNRRRGTLDWQYPQGERSGLRINAMLEDSESFRDGFTLQRRGIHPTLRFGLDENTTLDVGLEHFSDERVADRGIPSWDGKPVALDPSTFVGNPEQSPVTAVAHAFDITLNHQPSERFSLRNRFRFADYDKFYQNVFGNGTQRTADGRFNVTLAAYSQKTLRENWFNQTDLVWTLGDANGIRHTLMTGVELGQQDTRNRRLTGSFAGSSSVPLENPHYAGTVVFAPRATDANNAGTASTAAAYLQDQITLTEHWQLVLGARYDHFRLRLHDNRDGNVYRSEDNLLSPRAGLLWKPRADMSVYASYSVAFQPRGGEQLASLTAGNRSLEPEEFRNREIGLKWDLRPDLSLSVAAYRLDRHNVAITDPADSTRQLLVDGQRAEGVELGIAGRITPQWQIMGGYAWQDGEILTTQSASIPAGNRLAQLPEHSASLWNRIDLNDRIGFGVGAIYRDSFHPSTDNAVTVPGFVRWDAAVFYQATARLHLQLNIENLFDRQYFSSAHSNHNISPGAPRGGLLTARVQF